MSTHFEVKSNGLLYRDGSPRPVCAVARADRPATGWADWLGGWKSFRFAGCTAIAERRSGRSGEKMHKYYYLRRRHGSKVVKAYLGRPRNITMERLQRAARKLNAPLAEELPVQMEMSL